MCIYEYKITDLDKSLEVFVLLCSQTKILGYTFIIINAYLRPENTSWGKDATGFMSFLQSLIYTTCEYDAVYLVGDVNSRIVLKKD